MKRLILVLSVLLIASPAWAVINITAIDRGGGIVDVNYSGTELARAYALNISVDAGIIVGISNYARGDNNNGYGIFPANFSRYITVLPNGQVDSWDANDYSPVANASDPNSLAGLGTAGITIEMGSLYTTKAPPLSGRLCTIECSEACNLTITTNARRGGVVLENSSPATVNLTGAQIHVGTGGAALATLSSLSTKTNNTLASLSSAITYTGKYPEQWVAVARPQCWIAKLNPRQCRGDADGASQGKENFWVSTNDLNILIEAFDKPLSDLKGNQICADFDHLPQGQKAFRVSTNDLDILIANWKIANGPAPDCP
jgi:hypothetical protein